MKNHYQNLVHSTIPVSKSIGWRIEALSATTIRASTQLKPNINIHQTAFAGSLYAAAMASAWTLLKCCGDALEYKAELVAAEGNIQYLKPVPNDFLISGEINTQSEQYLKLLERVSLNQSCAFKQSVEIHCDSQLCAILTVQFVFKV
ncbi:YiiD C-terminal domain-containing protein [Aliikangiella sp. IMCC44653]